MRDGARQIVLADIFMPGMTAVGTALEKEGAAVLCVKTDVSVEESVNNLVAKAVEKFGRIDYAANCAGVMDARKFSDAKPSDVSFAPLS